MPLGLRVHLIRELHPHFSFKVLPKVTDQSGTVSAGRDGRLWNVLGSSDLLSVEPFEEFSSASLIDQESQSYWDSEAPGGRHELTLLNNPYLEGLIQGLGQTDKDKLPQYILTSTLIENLKDDCEFLRAENRSKFLLLRIAVSSVTIDSMKEFEDVTLLLSAIHFEMLKICSHYQNKVSFYLSLGGIDFVGILRIDDKLTPLMEIVQKLRQLLVDNIVSSEVGRNLKWKEGKQSLNHHVFSSVTGIFCYRDSAVFEQLKDEDDIQVVVRSRMAPGHQIGPSNFGEYGVSWGERSVANLLASPKQLLTAGHIGKSPYPAELFQEGFDGSVTEIFFSGRSVLDTLKESATHSPVFQSLELKKQVDELRKINVEKVIGPVQAKEISKVLGTLSHALRRNERLGAVRDLMPFFRQLIYCFNDKSWGSYLKSDLYSSEVSSLAFGRLTDHAWRSIRNRIESRIENLDPSFPGTLDNGLSKLINGYSVCAWICWDLFSLGKVPDSKCTANRFASCVCSGSAGRVECQEVFSELRRHKEGVKPLQSLSQRKRLCDEDDEKWNSRLLLLNISGPVLLRPEAAFSHCMHEMAEYSEWADVENEGCTALRGDINRFQYRAFLGIVARELRKTGMTKEVVDLMTRRAKLLFVFGTLAHRDPASIDKLSYEEAKEKAEQVWTDTSVTELLALLHLIGQNLANADFSKRLLGRMNSNCLKRLAEPVHTLEVISKIFFSPMNDSRVSERSLVERLAALRDIVREATADFGMTQGVSLSLGRTMTNKDVNYTFAAMLESVLAWLPVELVSSAIGKILQRWLIQYRAMNQSPNWEGIAKTEIEEYFRKFAKTFFDKQPSEWDALWEAAISVCRQNGLFDDQFTKDRNGVVFLSLASIFRRAKTRKNLINFPTKETIQARLLSKFSAAWDIAVDQALSVESSSLALAREDLVLSLWSKSQLICLEEVFSA